MKAVATGASADQENDDCHACACDGDLVIGSSSPSTVTMGRGESQLRRNTASAKLTQRA